MSDLFCTLCRDRRHTIRKCPRVRCNSCQQLGHQLRDCREMRRIKTVDFYFAHEETVRSAVTARQLRDTPNIGAFLRTLPEMEPTVESHNQFSAYGNRLHIDYGEQEDIIVSLQNGFLRAETMVHISPENIKISPKYSIYNGELYEDNVREATGENSMPAPPATVHVLLINRELFNTVVCLEVNENKYYLEWLNVENDAWAVVISSQHMYNFRRKIPAPRPIAHLREFFSGRLTRGTEALNSPTVEAAAIAQAEEREITVNVPIENRDEEVEVLVLAQVAPQEEIAEQHMAGGHNEAVGGHEATEMNVEATNDNIPSIPLNETVTVHEAIDDDMQVEPSNTTDAVNGAEFPGAESEAAIQNGDQLSPDVTQLLDQQFAVPEFERPFGMASDSDNSEENCLHIADENE